MPHISIAAERLFFLFDIPVTNTLLTSWVVGGVLILGAVFLFRKIDLVPAAFQNVIEVFVEWIIGMMESTLDSRQRAEQYFPLVATIFLFILVSNWLGIFPGIGSILVAESRTPVIELSQNVGNKTAEGRDEKAAAGHGSEKSFVPLFRSAASDLNFTLALAVVAVITINVLGAAAIGFRKHLSKYFSLKSPITFFVGILEFISEIAKIISFSFRLFGNVFAGEVLLVITAFLVPYFIPVPFLMLEVFVGFIQALVFAMLTMVFISLATAHH
ncbi:MAG: ATP synthase F0 subunit A [Candidatus Sungbacteria bacterium RIFCSPHIGHO2_02_FULL_47_11]|uniref:ATP synthase subunit a n=1 Tax=Candidatus Sungbacteria bacterium RIFCSPHIGHO2_02_FULL_47_11 TaxID=1802270 RepID=A0A1G2KMB9_9BACT|nr:MAG: ATP synthase F0 subunit A [Candidatus Sungbacteria bacterium RIFCSPHIGHO2_02_FULL_47_11]